MNGKWLVLILLTALVNALSGCGTIPPATVTPQAIRNPKVGYDGYELRIPEGYRVADIKAHPPEANALLSSGAEWIETEAKRHQWVGGDMDFYESYLVLNGKYTVLFAAGVFQLEGNALSMLADHDVRGLLEQQMSYWHEYTSGREVQRIGERMVGWVSIDQIPDARPKTACRIVLVPGKYTEYFFLIGYCASEDKDGLDPLLKDLVTGLKF
jgi:hypothetical protein